MVDVSDKKTSKRVATAKATVFLGKEVLSHFKDAQLHTKKGPVFQTAIVAGIQAVKKTSELIPMCHPLPVSGVDISIDLLDEAHIEILCTVKIEGKTGVEMEALTAASVAALTIYDMCKAVDREMEIRNVGLLSKSGGKSGDWQRTPGRGA